MSWTNDKNCLKCGEPLPAAGNYPAWCAACEWGIARPAEQLRFVRALVNRWCARQAEGLFRQVSGTAIRRPGWSVARLVSYAFALVVHLFCIGLIIGGIWLIVAIPNVITVILAIFALFLGYQLRPRLGSLRRFTNVRYRADAPVLFGVLDEVAAGVGAKPAHVVVVNGRWNATYSAVGWRRRRVVTLGLPVWDTLSADQKVAILGHEFGHGVNGDARRGLIIGTSLASLARLYAVLRSDLRLRSGVTWGVRSGQAVQDLLRGVVAAAFWTQQLISLRAGQRAEYLADALGARVASPAAMASALDVMDTGWDTFKTVREQRARRKLYPVRPDAEPSLWDELHAALKAVPERELERRRRVSAHALPQVTDTHPPYHLRIAMLRGLPQGDARVRMSAAQEDKIRAELATDYARIGA